MYFFNFFLKKSVIYVNFKIKLLKKVFPYVKICAKRKNKSECVMKIRNVDFGESPLFLAPMAGVSDVGFREQAVKFGADATVTEMLSTRAMVHNPKKTNLMTITSPYEKLVVAQIFGHESEFMVKAFTVLQSGHKKDMLNV